MLQLLGSLALAYKALGYKETSVTSPAEMLNAVVKQHPSPSLVFQKLVTCWRMAPIKSKRKDVVKYFRQGKVAEPIIHANVPPFIKTNTKGLVLPFLKLSLVVQDKIWPYN
jgi:hypothetical protein